MIKQTLLELRLDKIELLEELSAARKEFSSTSLKIIQMLL